MDNIPATARGYDVPGPLERAAHRARAPPKRWAAPAPALCVPERHAARANAPAAAGRCRRGRWCRPRRARVVHFRAAERGQAQLCSSLRTRSCCGRPGRRPHAARAYASYRASAAGGGYDTLLVTAPQLYDQFHYGERSLLALRHFALWAERRPRRPKPSTCFCWAKPWGRAPTRARRGPDDDPGPLGQCYPGSAAKWGSTWCQLPRGLRRITCFPATGSTTTTRAKLPDRTGGSFYPAGSDGLP
ncbi:MAG: hypothetical protein WKG07_41985 [Hymenobacter sp.]